MESRGYSRSVRSFARHLRLDDLYLGDCGAHVAWCDGDDCTRVVCEGSRQGNGAPWCDAETQVQAG